MSNIKKIIGVVLALVMALSVTTIAFAAAGDTYSVKVTADKTTLAAGETATVTVSVTTNYNVSTMSIPVFFDKTLVTVSEATTTLTGELKEVAIVTAGENIDKFYKGSGYAAANYGVLALTYIAKDGAAIQTYTDTTVMTFKVTALADVSGNAVVGCAPGTVKTSTNTTGTLYVGKNSSGEAIVDSSAEVIDAADLTSATATITIGGGAAEPNTLAIKDTAPFAPTIDTANAANADYTGFIYGIDTLGFDDPDMQPAGALSDFLTTTLGDEYLVIESVGGIETTGTIIKVLDADGVTPLETYVFIYFGDVDMDGGVSTSDSYICEYYTMNYMGFDSLYQYMAADVDGDGSPGTSDAYYFDYYAMNYTGLPSQVDVAAMVSANEYSLF